MSFFLFCFKPCVNLKCFQGWGGGGSDGYSYLSRDYFLVILLCQYTRFENIWIVQSWSSDTHTPSRSARANTYRRKRDLFWSECNQPWPYFILIITLTNNDCWKRVNRPSVFKNRPLIITFLLYLVSELKFAKGKDSE